MSKELLYSQYWQAVANIFDYLDSFAERKYATHKVAYNRFEFNLFTHGMGDSHTVVVNKQFRALYCIDSTKAEQVGKLIKLAESLHDEVMQAYEAKSTKRPLYLPYLVQDDRLETVTLHENIAHSSQNFRGDDLVPVAQVCVKYGRNGDVINDVVKDRADLVSIIEANGFEYTTEMLDKEQYWEQFYIKAIDLSNRFQCDSIQLRRATGKQYRYSMFGVDKDGYKTASKPKSLGVMVLVGDVKIVEPAQRKQRIDAITRNHPDVIDLGFAINGVMHRKYDKK